MLATAPAQLREDRTIARATRIIERRWQDRIGPFLPETARLHFMLRMHGLEREVFDVAFLDARLCLLTTERMFTGTLTGSEVHVREVVRAALLHNAASVIVAHNHPSGVAEPSLSDKVVTKRLRTALEMMDVRLLDHIIIGGKTAYSFAAEGW